MDIFEHLDNDYDLAEFFQNTLIGHATSSGGGGTEASALVVVSSHWTVSWLTGSKVSHWWSSAVCRRVTRRG